MGWAADEFIRCRDASQWNLAVEQLPSKRKIKWKADEEQQNLNRNPKKVSQQTTRQDAARSAARDGEIYFQLFWLHFGNGGIFVLLLRWKPFRALWHSCCWHLAWQISNIWSFCKMLRLSKRLLVRTLKSSLCTRVCCFPLQGWSAT